MVKKLMKILQSLVAPKITVKNVEAYATSVPVTISNGANKAEITMPDGTVTKLEAKDGN